MGREADPEPEAAAYERDGAARNGSSVMSSLVRSCWRFRRAAGGEDGPAVLEGSTDGLSAPSRQLNNLYQKY